MTLSIVGNQLMKFEGRRETNAITLRIIPNFAIIPFF